MSLLLPSTAPCGLSLTPFLGTIRYICFSASDGLDFHLRIHHLHKDASICPPSWLGCIIACLPVFIADAKSLQMLHHFLFPMPVIFQSFFFLFFFFSLPVCVLLLSAQSGHFLKEACLCYSQAHSYLVARLFSFLLPLFSLNTPGKFGYVSDIFSLSCCPFISPHQFAVCQDTVTYFDI